MLRALRFTVLSPLRETEKPPPSFLESDVFSFFQLCTKHPQFSDRFPFVAKGVKTLTPSCGHILCWKKNKNQTIKMAHGPPHRGAWAAFPASLNDLNSVVVSKVWGRLESCGLQIECMGHHLCPPPFQCGGIQGRHCHAFHAARPLWVPGTYLAPLPPTLLPRALPGLSWEQVVVSPSSQGLLVAQRTQPKSRGLCGFQGMRIHDKY